MMRLTSVRSRANTAVLMAVVIVFAILGIFTPAAGAAVSTSFLATHDSYVDSSRPNNNYGSRPFLRVDNTPLRTSFLTFDVNGAGPSSSAVLQIVALSNGSDVSIYQVADTTWDESTITAVTAPPVGAVIDTVYGINAGDTYTLDVSSVVTGDGTYGFALRTSDNTAIKFGSSESGNAPALLVPAPPPPASPSPFFVSGSGGTYTAASLSGGATYTGDAKTVVESAVDDLQQFGGGTITFDAGTIDLGSEHFELSGVGNIVFEGQGMSATTLINNSSAAEDTEVFDIVGADGLVIRDMTIAAGGPDRTTSDALDFDNGNNILIDRVRIADSRGRGIVFDGKGAGWSADGNVVRDCEIGIIPGDGIELLAASNNIVSGCSISGVRGHGIQINKSSSSATQPNKQSNFNTIQNTVIDQAGQDGININSSSFNSISGVTITNSSNVTANKDGIRINSVDGISCDANNVSGSVSSDGQATATQRWGLNISSSLCVGSVVGDGNTFAGNIRGSINDSGTNTQYSADTSAPSVPGNVAATALNHFEVEVTWSASTDDVGVDAYTVFRDGNPIGSVDGSTLSLVDSGVNPATTYAYEVNASDASGNASAVSAPPAAVTTPAAPSSFTLTSSADSYIRSSSPNNNYGTSSALRIDASPDTRSFIRFDVGAISGSITQATLRVYAASNSSQGFNLFTVADTSWTEQGITYANAPAFGPLIGSSGAFSSGAYIDIDVTSSVAGPGPIVFGLGGISNTAVRFDSRSGSNPPELFINTTP